MAIFHIPLILIDAPTYKFGYKRLRYSEDIIKTKSRHMDRQTDGDYTPTPTCVCVLGGGGLKERKKLIKPISPLQPVCYHPLVSELPPASSQAQAGWPSQTHYRAAGGQKPDCNQFPLTSIHWNPLHTKDASVLITSHQSWFVLHWLSLPAAD